MPHVYFVPGLAECSLSLVGTPGEVIWIGVPTAILGKFGTMRLAPDGENPGAPDGAVLVTSGTLAPYAGLPSSILQAQLAPHGYTVSTFLWDWRKSMLAAGNQLALRISNQISATDPCTLVCHSAGGLVARRAWSQLGLTNEQDKIRRIITLGTPHQGSYSAVRSFCGDSPIIDSLLTLNRTIGDTVGRPLGLFGYRRWTREQIRDMLLTWPSLYEIMPLRGGTDAADDPDREALYQGSFWSNGVAVQQRWLDHHSNVYAPWANSAASRPPAHVMICLAGEHFPTPIGLLDPERLGYADNFEFTNAGDSVLTVQSAHLDPSERWRVSVQHDNLYPTCVGTGDVQYLILLPHVSAPAPPPETVRTETHLVLLSPAPGQQDLVSWSSERRCGVAPCRC